MIMKIPMETTIENLKRLDEKEYERISVMISNIADKNTDASIDDVLAFGEQMCNKHSEAFKVLAN